MFIGDYRAWSERTIHNLLTRLPRLVQADTTKERPAAAASSTCEWAALAPRHECHDDQAAKQGDPAGGPGYFRS